MDVLKAAKERRTIRQFTERKITWNALEKYVEAARLAPSARNVQELEFIAVEDAAQVERINAAVRFGGIVREEGRIKGEEPKAFIIIISENERASDDYTKTNAGIACHAIVLAAWEQGIGSCIMGSIEREKIKEILGIPENYSVQYAIALGYPKEKPVIEEAKGKNVSYWVDEKGTLHVPKRPLKEIMHKNKF